MLFAVQPNLKFTAKNMQELLSFVRIGLAAAAAGFDTKKMRLHGCLAPRQKLHADPGSGFQDFSLAGTHEPWIFRRGLKKRKDIRSIETRDAPQRRNRRAHLPPFERAEKTDRNLCGPRHLREGK